jgi:hypothetical protein
VTGDWDRSGAAHRYKRRRLQSRRFYPIGHDPDRVSDHLEESSGHLEAAGRAPLSHLQHTRPEQREERRVVRQYTDLAVVRRRDHRVGDPIEYRSLG